MDQVIDTSAGRNAATPGKRVFGYGCTLLALGLGCGCDSLGGKLFSASGVGGAANELSAGGTGAIPGERPSQSGSASSFAAAGAAAATDDDGDRNDEAHGAAGSGGEADDGGTGGDGGAGPSDTVGGTLSSADSSSPCEPSTQVLTSAFDTNIKAETPNANFAYIAEVNIVRGGTANSERALLWFDLNTVPAGKTLRSAQLQLTIVNNPGRDKIVEVHRVSQSSDRAWLEDQVTWQMYKTNLQWTNAGADFISEASDSELVANAAPRGSVVSFDVLPDALNFYAAPATNYGWLIKDSQEPASATGEHVYFASREHTTSDYRPKLVLSYCP